MDNNPNWENTSTTNPITNLISNRPASSTYSWLKLHWSNNTNKQLANVLGQLANTLNSNQTPSLNTNSRETKSYIPDTFSSFKPDKLNNFLFQYHLYFHTNPVQFEINIIKINFAMTVICKSTCLEITSLWWNHLQIIQAHLSYNMSYSSAAIIQVFHLP